MNYVMDVWEDYEHQWGWSIFNEYDEEVASSDRMFNTRKEAQHEAFLVFKDLYYIDIYEEP